MLGFCIDQVKSIRVSGRQLVSFYSSWCFWHTLQYRFADFSSLWKMLQLFRGCSAVSDNFCHAFHVFPYWKFRYCSRNSWFPNGCVRRLLEKNSVLCGEDHRPFSAWVSFCAFFTYYLFNVKENGDLCPEELLCYFCRNSFVRTCLCFTPRVSSLS